MMNGLNTYLALHYNSSGDIYGTHDYPSSYHENEFDPTL